MSDNKIILSAEDLLGVIAHNLQLLVNVIGPHRHAAPPSPADIQAHLDYVSRYVRELQLMFSAVAQNNVGTSAQTEANASGRAH